MKDTFSIQDLKEILERDPPTMPGVAETSEGLLDVVMSESIAIIAHKAVKNRDGERSFSVLRLKRID